jgi:hypothetical protein
MVTIDEAIELLQKAKASIGGDKVLILSLTGSELEDANVDRLELINDGNSQYIEVQVNAFNCTK